MHTFITILLLTTLTLARAEEDTRHFRAHQSFDYDAPILFQTDFSDNTFDKLNLSEDARYRIPAPDPNRIRFWRDGEEVYRAEGPNVYATIGVDYTPYLKTGIYRPEWHLDDDRKRKAFESAENPALSKTIYVTGLKVGSERATYKSFAQQ